MSLSVYGKGSFVPKYTSMISIAGDGKIDTSYNESRRTLTELEADNGLFNVVIEHEALTVKKIKRINHLETMAAWATLGAVFSSVSSLSSSPSQRFRGRMNMYVSTTLAAIYDYNATSEKKLAIDVYIKNKSSDELLIADMERGLTWYLAVGNELKIPLPNPDVVRLRISDLHHQSVRYVTAAAGSTLKRMDVKWENDDYWAFTMVDVDEEGLSTVTGYIVVNKATGEQQQMTRSELSAFRKEQEK